MAVWALAFLIVALVLFILSAVSVQSGRVNLVAAGLAALTAATLVGRLGG